MHSISLLGLLKESRGQNLQNFVPSALAYAFSQRPNFLKWELRLRPNVKNTASVILCSGAKGAWHPRNFRTVLSGTRRLWQFYYLMLCFTLKIRGFTNDWHPLFQIPNLSPADLIYILNLGQVFEGSMHNFRKKWWLMDIFLSVFKVVLM